MHGHSSRDFQQKKRQLLTRAREGSMRSFAELLDLYRPFLRIWARRSAKDPLRNKFDTSDLIQDTHQAALNRFEEFRALDENEFSAQLKELLKAQVSASRKRFWRAEKRKINREVRLDEQGSWNRVASMIRTDGDAHSDRLNQEKLRERLDELMAELTPEDQLIIRQRVNDALKWGAIGQLHGIEAAAARMRFNRAAARLAKLYRKRYPRSS